MEAEQIKRYIQKGGKFFLVKSIEGYRDGETLQVITTENIFYINRNTIEIHSDSPITKDNIIVDFLLREYLLYELKRYIEKQKDKIDRESFLIERIIRNHTHKHDHK
jgi:hypothetical protein